MQPPTVREVIRRLEQEGWVLERQKGGRRIFKRDGVTIPVHGKDGDTLTPGTYASIRRIAGW